MICTNSSHPSWCLEFIITPSLTSQYLGGPPLGEVCLDHCPQGDRVVDDQEDAIMEQTNSVILLMTSFSFDRRVTG